MKIKDLPELLKKIGELEINVEKKLSLEPANFRVNSKGWKRRKQNGVTFKVNPEGDITEYVSGVRKDLKGEQLFTWDAAMRETKKAGKRMPTDEEFNELEKELLTCCVFPGYRDTVGAFYIRGSNTYFWSSSESGTYAWRRYLSSGLSTVYRGTHSGAVGFSVRCLKD